MTISFPKHWNIPKKWSQFRTDDHFIYFIYNEDLIVEYVGVTNQVYQRLFNHLRKPIKNTGFGKFYGREDINWGLYPWTFKTRKEAHIIEERLQMFFRLKTDAAKLSEGIKSSTSPKLSKRQEKNIIKKFQSGFTNAQLSRQYKVTPRKITSILKQHVQ